MKSIRTQLLAVALGTILTATAAFSQSVKPVHMHEHGMMGSDILRLSDALSLTDDQVSQMKDIMAKEKPGMKPLMQQMFQNHEALQQLVESGAFDEAKVRALTAQQAQTFQEMEFQHARVQSQMYQLLTADQKTKLASIRQKHQERWQQRMQEKNDATGTSGANAQNE